MSMPNIHKRMNGMLRGIIFLSVLLFLEIKCRTAVNTDLINKIEEVNHKQMHYNEQLWEQRILIETDYLLANKSFEIPCGKYINPYIVSIMNKLPYLPGN